MVTKICPLRFVPNTGATHSCVEDKCAWYCTYPNGEGECAIHSLPGLFDGLQDIVKKLVLNNS